MARRQYVSPKEAQRLLLLYYMYGTYAAVARVTGWSASTVSKHVRIEAERNRLANVSKQEFIQNNTINLIFNSKE